MRQFDLVRLTDGSVALILQADLLDHVTSRVAAPLVPAKAYKPVRTLNPIVRLGRKDYIIAVERLAAIEGKAIQSVVGTMRQREWDIRRALDLVFVGV